MARHSKWHNIQVRKGKQDKAKSGQFTKVARMITVAARSGGGDPTMNIALRLAIDKAKEVNMPKDNIDRAIKKGTGELKEGEQIEEVVYEGFGPGGVAVLVSVLTDNRNRSVADIKHIFAKHGGSMAGAGSVQWQFERKMDPESGIQWIAKTLIDIPEEVKEPLAGFIEELDDNDDVQAVYTNSGV